MEELSNKEQVELLKKWWNEYGWSILLAVVIGLGIGYGWRYYKGYQVSRQLSAEQTYQKVLLAVKEKKVDVIVSESNALVKQYSNTVYGTLARLTLAKVSVQQQKYAEAITELKWVVAHSHVVSLREIARLRAARVLVQQNNNKAALLMLSKVDDSVFLPAVKVLRETIAQKK